MPEKNSLTHFDDNGNPKMVDVSGKDITVRTATASGLVIMSPDAYQIAKKRSTKKGDPIAVAELAGVMAAKRTCDLIPLCHPLPIDGIKIDAALNDETLAIRFTASVKTRGRTGVEMEALTAVSGACLTFYDMMKAIDKSMTITDIVLLEKTGGATGEYHRPATGR